MGLHLPPHIVADIEWAVVALTGLIAIVSLLGALYTVPWTFRSRQLAATRAFNYLWITRALLQVIAALYALSLDLRLQVLWSARSVIIPGGYNVDAMCRLYIGLSFGLLEPSFLLLVLFACMYTVHKHTSEPGSNPNLLIFFLTVGLTLPMCAAQVFAALFSRIMTQLRYNEDLMHKFFAASASVSDTMCPDDPDNPNCAVCLFPEFSTLISATFALLYLLVLWVVLGRVAITAINRMLSRRIRLLQICISLFFCASITLRGVTVVNIDPYSLDFVALWLANVVVASGLILVVSAILVWVPVYDGRLAGARIGTPLQGPVLLDAPTELLPLVGYGKLSYSHDAASSEFEFSNFGDDLAGGDTSFHNGLLQRPLATSASAGNLSSSSDFRVGGTNTSSSNLAGMAAMGAAAAGGSGVQSGSLLDDYDSRAPIGGQALQGHAQKGDGELAAGSIIINSSSSSSAALVAAVGVAAGSSRPQQRRRGSQHRGLSPVGGGEGDFDSGSTSLMMP